MRPTTLAPVFLLSSITHAAGFYSKSSDVLEVDGRSYEKLIAKSNYTSIVEFYAPWCGHCKNLKPAYEKVATSLSGVAKVAAINCDDDSNKGFCGSMGVKGFPTLKLVKPSKKGGKPIIQDYQGERTAKAIHEAVTEKIPNHVTKPKDDDIDPFLKQSDRPKAVFFTDKRLVGSMVKALAIDFLGSVDVAQVNSAQKPIVEKFKVDRFPSFYVMEGPDSTPEKYEGEMKKEPLKGFISRYATPNPEFPPTLKTKSKTDKKAPDPKKASKDTPKAAKKEASDDEEIVECPAGHGKGKNPHKTASSKAEEKVEEPTPSGKGSAAGSSEESPAPVKVDIGPAPPLRSLDTVSELSQACLNTRVGICLLALQPPDGDDTDKSALKGLSEISHKHVSRRSKLFPFYSVPSSNEAGGGLVEALGAEFPDNKAPVLLVLNLKRGWWNRYTGKSLDQRSVEDWVDNVRFGDFKKTKIEDVLLDAITAANTAGEENKKGNPSHEEL